MNNSKKIIISTICTFIILYSINLLFSNSSNISINSNITIENLEEGFDYFEGTVYIDTFKFTIDGLIIDPQKYQIAVAGLNKETYSGYTLGGFQKRHEAMAVITGGFRSSQNLPLGLVIEDGKISNRIIKKDPVITGILTVKNGEVDIIHAYEYGSANEYLFAIQAGPVIVEKGGINGIKPREVEIKPPKSRSFIAIQKTGKIIIGLSSDVHLYNLAEFLRSRSENGLNCNVALNLEGGGGEGLIIAIDNIQKSLRNVYIRRPNAIIIKRNIDK